MSGRMLLLLLSLLGLVLLASTVSAAQCSQPVFKDDALNRVEAGFKAIRKRGKLSYDYRTIEIFYYPFLMVEDPSCIKENQLNLEVKSGSGNWVAMSHVPDALGGGRYKWTVEAVPCKDHLIKFWVNGPGGQASLEYNEPIRAVSDEEITNSKFTPATPAGLKITHMGDKSVQVSWEPSDCATSYDISYGKEVESMKSQIVPASQGNQFIISEGLEPCTDYTINVFAVVGESEYSAEEASEYFTTPPDVSSADSLEPQVMKTSNSVVATWRAYAKLSCVMRYSVSVCKEKHECLESQEVTRNDALDYIKFENNQLEQCSAYTLQIKPIYENMNLAPKIVDFRTLSPKVGEVSASLIPVSATRGEGQKIYVSWSPVECAEFYEVFQKVNSAEGDWESVYKTEKTSVELNGVPCTEYRYGVQVTVDGAKSKIMEVPDAVVTELDNSAHFVAPNLEVEPTEGGAVLSWDHGACISSYVVRACSTVGDTVCEEDTIVRDSTVHNITVEIHNLGPCSRYTLEILPQIAGNEFEPHQTEFMTRHPKATPPASFSAEYKKGSNKVELQWEEVKCSSGYKILQMIGTSETTTAWETDDPRLLFKTLESPEPCVTYRYGLASVVGGETSEPTPWKQFSIPPKQGVTHEPSLEVLENKNDTITLKINPAASNIKCQVEVYEVKYSSLKQEEVEERLVPASSLDNGRISLQFPGASGPGLFLEGRIKYDGFEVFSTWIQSPDPTILSQEHVSGGSILVPIIIGILVGIVVLVIVIFFFVKRKRNHTKYDAEKATNNKDETQKLNEHHPDA